MAELGELYQQALIDMDANQLDKAEDCFKTIVAADPHYAQAWNKLGVIYGSRGQLDEAISAFKTAITEEPKLVNAYSNLGGIYFQAGDLETAEKMYFKAIAIDEQYANAYHNLGVLYRKQGNISESIKYLKKATSLQRRRESLPVLDEHKSKARMIIWALFAIALVLMFIFSPQH